MDSYYRLRNQILLTGLAVSLTVTALASMAGYWQSGLSVLAGSLLASLNFYLLAREVARFQPGDGLEKAVPNLLQKSGLRWVILFLGMAVCARSAWLAWFPFLAGLLSIQGVIVVTQGIKPSLVKA